MNLNQELLVKGILEGDRLIIGKAISLIENGEKEGFDLLRKIYPLKKDIFVLGITGPLGVGKSTFIDKIIEKLTKEYNKIGVLLCDPSSPISGGAFLGDRLRLKTKNENVFIRSMATRNFPYGISPSLPFILDLFSASPYRNIVVETAGIGQGDILIKSFSHLTLVLLSPLLGDEIQFLKGGLMEIGDILIVTKGDYDIAETFYKSLKNSITYFYKDLIPVYMISSSNGLGLDEVYDEILKKREEIVSSNKYLEKEKIRRIETFKYLLRELYTKKVIEKIEKEGDFKDIEEGKINIYKKIFEILS
ncbi:MAG: ArgK/MeaB family GTPase [Caldisericia bacterium]